MLVICGSPTIFIRPFSLTLGDMTLENYYGLFWAVCKDIRLSNPISFDIATMERHLESMWVDCFLSVLSSSFDDARSQIPESKELLYRSEVFNRLRQATLPSAAPSPTN